MPELDWSDPGVQRRLARLYRQEQRKMDRWIRRNKIDLRPLAMRCQTPALTEPEDK